MLLRPRRRRVDVLRAFEVRLLQRGLVDEEVLRAGLAPDVPSPSRARARSARAPACRRRGRRRAVRPRPAPAGSRGSSPRPRSPSAASRACQIGSVLPSATARLTMMSIASPFSACTITRRSGLGGDLHGLEERLVVDHDRALVRHEELVGGDALLGQLGEVLERAAVVEVGDGDVEADVDHRLAAVDLLVVRSRAPARTSSPGACMQKSTRVVVPPNAAAIVPGREVVDRRRAAEEHLDVRVRVDRARDARACRRRRSSCRR